MSDVFIVGAEVVGKNQWVLQLYENSALVNSTLLDDPDENVISRHMDLLPGSGRTRKLFLSQSEAEPIEIGGGYFTTPSNFNKYVNTWYILPDNASGNVSLVTVDRVLGGTYTYSVDLSTLLSKPKYDFIGAGNTNSTTAFNAMYAASAQPAHVMFCLLYTSPSPRD